MQQTCEFKGMSHDCCFVALLPLHSGSTQYSSEKGAIIIFAIFFFILNFNFNLYNDVFLRKIINLKAKLGTLVHT
jgi:hypothetical protein